MIAIEALQQLRDFGFTIGDEQIVSGMAKTVWNGRFTRIGEKPDFLVDGAHNPDAARRLKTAIEQYYPGQRLYFVIGMFKDKQVDTIMRQMAPMAEHIFAMETPDNDRAMPVRELAGIIERYNPAGDGLCDDARSSAQGGDNGKGRRCDRCFWVTFFYRGADRDCKRRIPLNAQ